MPSSHDTARCGPGVVYFAASGSAFGYKWFDSFTGGNSLTDKFEYSTTLTNTTIFFVASVSAEGCESKRREVKGTINPKPTSPSGKDSSRCGPGSVHLSASKSLFSYYWYSNNSDTNFIKKGNEFNTPAIENSTSFYVTSVSDKGCESEIKT